MESRDKPGGRQNLYKKAFEISYALLRVTGSLKGGSLARNLESQAWALLASVSLQEYMRSAEALMAIESLTRLAREASIINSSNCDIIISEVAKLSSAINEATDTAILPDLHLEEIFSKNHINAGNQMVFERTLAESSSGYAESLDNPATDPASNPANSAGFPGMPENRSSVSQKSGRDRQELMLGKIKDAGVCRFKDIQDSLPYLSERTIRYDLQKLTERGVLERIGGGGPSTYYKLKN